MTKYAVVFEDKIENGNTFETDEINIAKLKDLAWNSAYEVALSDIKDVDYFEVDDKYKVETMVAIPKQEYEKLLSESRKYWCLENVGVDNWNDYHYAIKDYEEETGKEWWE